MMLMKVRNTATGAIQELELYTSLREVVKILLVVVVEEDSCLSDMEEGGTLE